MATAARKAMWIIHSTIQPEVYLRAEADSAESQVDGGMR